MSDSTAEDDFPHLLAEDGGEYLSTWADAASAEDFEDVAGLLLSVTDGTVFGVYRHWPDPFDDAVLHVEARLGLLVTLMRSQSDAAQFTILRIGPTPKL